jgi:hypothetical protein
VTLNVTAPGQYTVRLATCLEVMAVDILSVDGTSALAAGESATAPSCPSVSYRFDTTGLYPVRIRKSNAAGCSVNGSVGDFTIRVASVP